MVRQCLSFNVGWKFHPGHATDPAKDFNYGTARLFAKTAENYGTCINPGFNDSSWQTVQLPHDWVVRLPFVNTENAEVKLHGYKPVGGLYPQNSIGWYRKNFFLPEAENKNRVSIRFDGVFRNAQVWVNNIFMGNHFSGYTGFSFDITDVAHFGKQNTIVVRVDATQFEGWFYEGAGIYRNTWLEIFPQLHFRENEIVVTSDLEQPYTNARINISAMIANRNADQQQFAVETIISDPSGKEVGKTITNAVPLDVYGTKKITSHLNINKPLLWSVDQPSLYRAVVRIKSSGQIIDEKVVRFGIRDIQVDAAKGLFVNGKHVKIKGVCVHQDHAGVGSALPDYLQYYRISLLKEMGANAYRASHNPPTPELLDACDSLGMLVLDETRLLTGGKEYLQQFQGLVKRDRNHPSVFMWSIGNEEETIQQHETGKRTAATYLLELKKLDTTRTATYGANLGNIFNGINEVIPVRGFNYNISGLDAYKKEHPDQPVLGTEVGSTVTTRGVYVTDSAKAYLSDFDENYPPWASTAEQWWKLAVARDWMMGGFVWTGFDYRGEPTPFQWPNINSHFGIMDMCGFPKSIYYYYQSWWTGKDVLHIAPHWNWKGKEGQPIKVWVNSNADEVELFLNKKSLGKQKMPRNGHLEWQVKYQPGELRAVARKGKRVFERSIRTTGPAASIILSSPRKTILADGRDATVINVSVNDRNGNPVPDASSLIHFAVKGDAKIIGVGNGDPSCHEPDQYPEKDRYSRSLFNGKCQAILRSGTTPGEITITANSAGLQSSGLTLSQFNNP
ncbi:MAG: beta-galactosidase GalA [Niabella sp.]